MNETQNSTFCLGCAGVICNHIRSIGVLQTSPPQTLATSPLKIYFAHQQDRQLRRLGGSLGGSLNFPHLVLLVSAPSFCKILRNVEKVSAYFPRFLPTLESCFLPPLPQPSPPPPPPYFKTNLFCCSLLKKMNEKKKKWMGNDPGK